MLEHDSKVDKAKNTTKRFWKVRLEISKKIMWPGNRDAPKDSPECGFEGEHCPKPNKKDKSKSSPFRLSTSVGEI